MRGDVMMGTVFFLGILSAIAIPAYHDYTLRTRVVEGLNMASAVKAGVAEYYGEHGEMPRDLRQMKYEAVPRGRFVTFVAVNRGTIVIRFNKAAGHQLSGHQLTLTPAVSAEGDLVWACGYRSVAGTMAGPVTTDIAPKYLPSSCRPG
jgi:type IV pilus assembly protein PilA